MKGFVMAPVRIRIKIGQCEEGPSELIGKWFVELHVCDNTKPGIPTIGEPFQIGPFDTEEIAKRESKNAAKVAVEACGGSHFLDMKNGNKGMQPVKDLK